MLIALYRCMAKRTFPNKAIHVLPFLFVASLASESSANKFVKTHHPNVRHTGTKRQIERGRNTSIVGRPLSKMQTNNLRVEIGRPVHHGLGRRFKEWSPLLIVEAEIGKASKKTKSAKRNRIIWGEKAEANANDILAAVETSINDSENQTSLDIELGVQEENNEDGTQKLAIYIKPVSYTHLTLPTICSV